MQSAEVDDPGNLRFGGRPGHVLGRRAFRALKVAAAAHRMNEVVEHVDVRTGGAHGCEVAEVSFDDLNLPGPGDVLQLLR
jgi:hypothetical protein